VPATRRTIAASYTVSKGVYEGTQKRIDGVDFLNGSHGLNRNSANDLIYGYRHLRRGEVFQRSLSVPYMDYYLAQILKDNGVSALQTALHSLWQHIAYYEGIQQTTMHSMRSLAAKFQESAGGLQSELQAAAESEKAVRRATSDNADRRRKRLTKAPKVPQRVPILVLGFARNPDVVAEVMLRANGKCEGCQRDAPFLRRKDGTPYLEMHHIKQLADGGEDTVENALALCPNCHRQRHFGAVTAT
jgi:5-methylcytosine-specific restriction enzyme A